MRILDRLDDRGFGDLARGSFHHHDGFLASRHEEIQQARLNLRIGGIGHQLPLHQSHSDPGDGRGEWNVREVKRRRAGHQRDGVRVIVGVGRQHHGDNLRFVAKALGEEGPHRAVNQPAGENFLFRRAPFALEKSAGYFPRRVGVLAVVHREGKEINSLARLVRAGGCQHHRIAVANHCRAVGLPGHPSHFNRQIVSAERNADLIHNRSPLNSCAHRGSRGINPSPEPAAIRRLALQEDFIMKKSGECGPRGMNGCLPGGRG